jgi:EmrB/QacA subfamily drug resistance transporter
MADPAQAPRLDSRPWAAVAVLCLAVFVINVSTTIMNVALPSIALELDASTRDLLWVVDSFNLTFAGLVLAAGTLSDRYGRRRALLAGLAVFGLAAAAGAASTSAGMLIGWRALMGVGAAVIFPATLSIIVNLFEDRTSRAKAIGVWGATTGLAVALGPILGGAVLERFWWGSAQLLAAPVAAAAFVLARRHVPESRDPDAPAVDRVGVLLSALALGGFVYAVIEAPERGWGSTPTLLAFAGAGLALVAFIAWERRVPEPMLDVRIFGDMRFSAASGAVTFSFFALFGFIFLVTLYFQFLKGYTPLETGVRLLPVAACVAISNVVGVRLAVRLGTKVVVVAGLLLQTAAYLWIARLDVATGYGEIAVQMVLLGTGMGLTGAPATEAIMGVVPVARAGVGSAVNDATRELGGTVGVAVIGSVFLSLYRSAFDDLVLPAAVVEPARDSVAAAVAQAGILARSGQGEAASVLGEASQDGFFDGLAAGCYVAAGVSLAGALLAALFLPAHPGRGDPRGPADVPGGEAVAGRLTPRPPSAASAR